MSILNFKNQKVRVLFPLLLLLVPLIGMRITEEINWSLFDFIIMGVLILSVSIGINFTLSKTKNLKNRIIYIGILGLLFLLVWAELAVGIFGSPFAGN
ncbi:MAG: hypothetical protein RLZ50_1246 [Bacteroidota bacterium]|jgi:hypothetical protein